MLEQFYNVDSVLSFMVLVYQSLRYKLQLNFRIRFLPLVSIHIYRCSAVCLVFSFAYLGEALAPLIMKLQLQTQAVVPLGVMGLLSLTTGFLCQFFLPKTKGREIETFEDSTEIDGLKERSPKFYRRRTTNRRSQQVEMTESTENTVNDARCDEDAVRNERLFP